MVVLLSNTTWEVSFRGKFGLISSFQFSQSRSALEIMRMRNLIWSYRAVPEHQGSCRIFLHRIRGRIEKGMNQPFHFMKTSKIRRVWCSGRVWAWGHH